LDHTKFGNKLTLMVHRHRTKNYRHTRSVAYSVELVVLNKHQISGGGAYLHRYHNILRWH